MKMLMTQMSCLTLYWTESRSFRGQRASERIV